MKKFDLSIYKSSKPYFDLLDIYIKEQGIRKEAFLIEIGVTPSSYRKCRKGELNIGHDIVGVIARQFSFKVPSDEFLDEIEKFTNKVYRNIYYKNFKTYKEDMEYIDNMLSENYIIFPMFKLLKLFMIAASNEDVSKIQNNNRELYDEVALYQSFFEYGINDLFEIIYLVFTDTISKDHWIKNYKNGMSYFVLSTRSYLEGRYIESIFYGDKCKKMLFEDGNVNRLFYLNNTIMSSLIYVENYEECADMAFRQLASLESINFQEKFQFTMSKKFRILALLGEKKYDLIKEENINNFDMTLTELVCMIIAMYLKNNKDKKYFEYEKYYEELEVDTLPEEYSVPIKLVDQMLKSKSKAKKIVPMLKNYEIMPHLEKILQNIVLG